MNRVKRVIHATAREIGPYSGAGVTAALLDTGFAMHPDIARQLVCFRDFLGNWDRPYDDCGHGTHVAGCLCGSGRCSGGMYAGVAPGCRIVACKVLDEKGEGTVGNMIAGIQYVLQTRSLYHTRILNLSVGVGQIREKDDQERLQFWLCQAWRAGLFVAVAAGNNGPFPNSISPLALSPCVVAVGCHDGRERSGMKKCCDDYSGRGPEGNFIKKPDIVAPGTDIISCNAGFTQTRWGQVKNPYTVKSGTSMAVPAVSGAAALLMQKFPLLNNGQIRDRLLLSAQDMRENWGKQGWGMLCVQSALRI